MNSEARSFSAPSSGAGCYSVRGLGQPGQTACSAWEKDPMRFSKAIAQEYVSTEMNQQLTAESVRCRPDNKVCEVTFPGQIIVGVSHVKVPEYVIARQMYARAGARRREFDYSCAADGTLKLIRRPDIVRFILIDPGGFFKNNNGLRKDFMSRLEQKFNNLEPNWLKQNLLKFRVEYRADEPSAEEKENFRKLDFPIYFLDQNLNFDVIRKRMEQHQIPTSIRCVGQTTRPNPYDLAQDCWKEGAVRGCGIPSGDGFRTICFIKIQKVATDPIGRRDLVQAFLNVTSHEIGHMLNLCSHSKEGLMKYPLQLTTDIDFSPGDRGFVLANLARLRDLR